MKYIMKFNEEQDFIDARNDGSLGYPSIIYKLYDESISFTESNGINAGMGTNIKRGLIGDIVYFNHNNQLSACSLSNYDESLGPKVGVVVIPYNSLPGGYARFINLEALNDEGYCYDQYAIVDYPLDNFIKVAANNDDGYRNFVDIIEKNTNATESQISPYLTENVVKTNTKYQARYVGGTLLNALGDSYGLTNTTTLINYYNGDSEFYPQAARACFNYRNNSINWYLPAMGELGFLAAKLTTINASLEEIGAAPIDFTTGLWSSTEFSSGGAWALYMGLDVIDNYGTAEIFAKNAKFHVRPFGLLI